MRRSTFCSAVCTVGLMMLIGPMTADEVTSAASLSIVAPERRPLPSASAGGSRSAFEAEDERDQEVDRNDRLASTGSDERVVLTMGGVLVAMGGVLYAAGTLIRRREASDILADTEGR